MIVETPKEFTLEAYEEFLNEHTPWSVTSGWHLGQFELAQRVYDDAIEAGADQDDAAYEALDFLYCHSKFSILYALIDILEKHFAERVPTEKRREVALELYDDCMDLFKESPSANYDVFTGQYQDEILSDVIYKTEIHLSDE